jgi:hypothetical protein
LMSRQASFREEKLLAGQGVRTAKSVDWFHYLLPEALSRSRTY